MSNNEVTFQIKCTMNKRWVPYFMSMLKKMQYLGSVGSSRVVALYSDGDGDFRPKFEIEEKINFDEQDTITTDRKPDFLYDAG